MSIPYVPPDLYLEILQFYAGQMQALDNKDFATYASTFTEDGEFQHSPSLPAARTPAGIERELASFHERKFGGSRVQRRHWFNHVSARTSDDGRIHATSYALVVTTFPGGTPEITPSCVVHDVLVRGDDQRLRLRSRRVEHDHDPASDRQTTEAIS